MSAIPPALVLTVRQPWAWMIIHGGKDVENRTWPTKLRGRVLIHAAKGMTWDEYFDAWFFAMEQKVVVPKFELLERGGIIGEVEIVDCVTWSVSPWHFGSHYGFVLRDPKPLPFQPCRGGLGFWRLK